MRRVAVLVTVAFAVATLSGCALVAHPDLTWQVPGATRPTPVADESPACTAKTATIEVGSAEEGARVDVADGFQRQREDGSFSEGTSGGSMTPVTIVPCNGVRRSMTMTAPDPSTITTEVVDCTDAAAAVRLANEFPSMQGYFCSA